MTSPKIIWEHNNYTKKLLTEEVLNPFGQYLETDIFQLIQNIRLSPFIKSTQQLPDLAQFYGQFSDLIKLSVVTGEFAPNYLKSDYNEELMSSLKIHVEIFKELVRLYNKYVQPDKKLNLLESPNTGSVTWGCCRVDNKIQCGRKEIKINFEE